MNPWLQLLGSGGIAAIAVVVVNAVANRKNLGATTARTDAEANRTDAETDELIRKTYGGMLADMQGQLNSAVTKASELTVRVAELEDEREEGRRVLQLHAAWDHMAITKLRECDPPMALPDPPPLTIPSRRRKRGT